MAKVKTIFVCRECGSHYSKWVGQCAHCQAWSSIEEEVQIPASPNAERWRGYASATESRIQSISEITLVDEIRLKSGFQELDRVLGGGIVVGSVILLGGDPGIGKSTLMLQALDAISKNHRTLYVTGEESCAQIVERAQRTGSKNDRLRLLAETQIERILSHIAAENPRVVIIDSIQTMYTDSLTSAPGSVSQVRESAAQLVRYAKAAQVALVMVGHVTKEGALAGPRVLEHMVDTVLYFEGDPNSRMRAIRSVKNRFGAVNELGVFAMTERGLREVTNPSALFLSRQLEEVTGSVVTAAWEGSRPLLIEIQALVDTSYLTNPRRVVVGVESNRLAILLAVLHQHGGIATYNQDVFINVVGGLRINETAADLAVLLAVSSSLKKQSVSRETVIFGEIGLGGELRPVPSGQERLQEAVKHGFKRAIIPYANAPKKPLENLNVIAVQTVKQALASV